MALLIVPACLLVLALLVGPMILMFRISLNQFSPTQLMIQAVLAGELHQGGDRSVLSGDHRYHARDRAALHGLLTLVLAFPAAYRLGRMESRWKSLAVIATLFPAAGRQCRALRGMDGAVRARRPGQPGAVEAPHLISEPLKIMYTPKAVIIGIIAVVLPYMILTLSAVIESIPRDLEDAAANLGASGCAHLLARDPAAVGARRRRRLDPGVRAVHEHLCNGGASRRPAGSR